MNKKQLLARKMYRYMRKHGPVSRKTLSKRFGPMGWIWQRASRALTFLENADLVRRRFATSVFDALEFGRKSRMDRQR